MKITRIITAINNEKIFEELKNKKNIKIICNNVQYKEGILEILEKNKKINYIIFNENIYGQIKIEELIKNIKKINNKIKTIIILNKKDLIKEEYLSKNKIKYIYEKELTVPKILEKMHDKKRIFCVIGNNGAGKTITTLILSELIAKYKNKKILIIEDNIENNSILKIYKLQNKEKNTSIRNRTIKIKNNIYLFNIKKILKNYYKNKIKIVNEINKIKKNFDYIFIDTQNSDSHKIYTEITEENLLILNPNILEINKIKKYIIKSNTEIKTILNNYNENSISENIIKQIFKNKIKIIEKIENNKSYNQIINNNFNIEFLDKKTRNKYLKIIKNL
jgi:energy-coupling factor transporter ATP-binding protein EcfA2